MIPCASSSFNAERNQSSTGVFLSSVYADVAWSALVTSPPPPPLPPPPFCFISSTSMEILLKLLLMRSAVSLQVPVLFIVLSSIYPVPLLPFRIRVHFNGQMIHYSDD